MTWIVILAVCLIAYGALLNSWIRNAQEEKPSNVVDFPYYKRVDFEC